MPKITKVVAYVRAESGKQAGYTIQAQLGELEAYAEKNNLEIVKEFVEVGSAHSKRKGFNEMLKFLNSSKDCKTILVEKVEHLIRRIEDFELIDEGIDICTSKEGLIKNRLMAGIMLCFAEYEFRHRSEAIKRGLQAKKEKEMARKLEEETRKEVNNVK